MWRSCIKISTLVHKNRGSAVRSKSLEKSVAYSSMAAFFKDPFIDESLVKQLFFLSFLLFAAVSTENALYHDDVT